MTVGTDVAVWLVDLLKTKWDIAVEQLRSEGTTIPKTTVPTIAKTSDSKVANFRLQNGVLVKVYTAGPERVTYPEWGMRTRDVRSTWVIDIQTDHPNSARQFCHAAYLITDRVLDISRKDPEPEWDLIEAWEKEEREDFQDYQHWLVTVTLARYSRVAATAIVDNS